ncbi:MAG TPA: hypothetical protein VGH86_07605, partial [Phenylobacterium sp.]
TSRLSATDPPELWARLLVLRLGDDRADAGADRCPHRTAEHHADARAGGCSLFHAMTAGREPESHAARDERQANPAHPRLQ